jgi:hypothetical protein
VIDRSERDYTYLFVADFMHQCPVDTRGGNREVEAEQDTRNCDGDAAVDGTILKRSLSSLVVNAR